VGKVKTVAVIGGGVSGLSAGGLLARHGVRVKLFEANDKLGGCCADTAVGGFTFSDGAVHLAFPGILDQVFKRLGLDRRSLLPLQKVTAHRTILPDERVVSIGDKFRVSFGTRVEKTETVRLRRELGTMRIKWEPVLRLFEHGLFTHAPLPSRLIPGLVPHLLKLHGTAASEIRKLFSDEAVRAAMAGSLLFTGLPAQKLPAPFVIALLALLSEGFYLPRGGMGKIPEALSRALKTKGAEIFLNAKVDKIHLKNGRVHGLSVDGQGPVEVDAVISTASGMETFTSLLNSRDSPAEMKRKVRGAPLSHRAVSIQLGLSNALDECCHSNSILPMISEQHRFFTPEGDEVKWCIYFVPTVTMPELAPRGGSVIEIFPAVKQDIPAEDWVERKTERVVDSALRLLSRRHPMEILVKRVRSPKDFETRMHLYKGAVYGLSAAADHKFQFPHASPIPGLYQAGQTTYPGFGVAPAAMSGILAAETLVKRERL
jgi:phytoene dehydrogenase-like protein